MDSELERSEGIIRVTNQQLSRVQYFRGRDTITLLHDLTDTRLLEASMGWIWSDFLHLMFLDLKVK